MNLWATMDLYGGGPGSGCQGPNCGRPESANHVPDVQPKKPGKWRQFDPKKVGGYFRPGTVVANIYNLLEAHNGEWMELNEIENRFVRTGAPVIRNRLKEIRYTGKRAGLWNLEIDETANKVRFRKLDKAGQVAPVQKQVSEPEDKPQPQKNASALEDTLREGKIVVQVPLGGGLNDSQMVRFEDNTKAVMKVDSSYEPMDKGRRSIDPGKGPQREAGAYEVAKLVGLTDLVPVTVIRQVGSKLASVQAFKPGKEAQAKSRDVRFDGNTDAARAAAFDYVIGNEDRHVGNWLLDNSGKITLIDHGLAFPERTNGMTFNQILIGYAQKKGFSPKEQAASYVANKDAITSALRDVGLREASIQGVASRIDKLATGNTYAAIAVSPSSAATILNEGYHPDDWRRGFIERTKKGR